MIFRVSTKVQSVEYCAGDTMGVEGGSQRAIIATQGLNCIFQQNLKTGLNDINTEVIVIS